VSASSGTGSAVNSLFAAVGRSAVPISGNLGSVKHRKPLHTVDVIVRCCASANSWGPAMIAAYDAASLSVSLLTDTSAALAALRRFFSGRFPGPELSRLQRRAREYSTRGIVVLRVHLRLHGDAGDVEGLRENQHVIFYGPTFIDLAWKRRRAEFRIRVAMEIIVRRIDPLISDKAQKMPKFDFARTSGKPKLSSSTSRGGLVGTGSRIARPGPKQNEPPRQ